MSEGVVLMTAYQHYLSLSQKKKREDQRPGAAGDEQNERDKIGSWWGDGYLAVPGQMLLWNVRTREM